MENAISRAKGYLESFINWATDSGADWALWGAAAVALFVVARIVRAFVAGLFRSRRADAGAFRNLIADVFSSTSSLFLLVISAAFTAPLFMELPEQWSTWLTRAVMVLAIVQGAIWIRVLVRAVMDGVIARSAADSDTFNSARNLIGVFVNIAIFALAGVMIIDNLGGDVTGLIAGLGVGGIAIGLAAQNIFKDLFASLSIILDKPFVKGQFVTFNGNAGTIEKIGLKTTRIALLSGEQLVVGNSELLDNEIHNYARMAERRVVLTLSATYSTPVSVLEALPDQIKAIVERQEHTRFDRCHVANYADSAIVLELVYYVEGNDYARHMDIKQRVFISIHKLFDKKGVDFAFPTRTVMLHGSAAADSAEK